MLSQAHPKGVVATSVIVFTVLITGCITPSIPSIFPSLLKGRISTASYQAIPAGATFIVDTFTRRTLTEQGIREIISAELTTLGYLKASNREAADFVVSYSYSIGAGVTGISSNYNNSTGETSVSSTTTYPRYFELRITRNTPTNAEMLWQGEVHSNGTTRNMSILAPEFVKELFKYFDQPVNNERFIRPFLR